MKNRLANSSYVVYKPVYGAKPSKCEHCTFPSHASKSANDTVLEPSFQLNVITSLSSYRNTEFTKVSTSVLRYFGSFMSPPLNLLIQNTICSFESGVFSIFSRAMDISKSAFFVSSSSNRCLAEVFIRPSSMALSRLFMRFSTSSSCFCRNGIVVFSRF